MSGLTREPRENTVVVTIAGVGDGEGAGEFSAIDSTDKAEMHESAVMLRLFRREKKGTFLESELALIGPGDGDGSPSALRVA